MNRKFKNTSLVNRFFVKFRITVYGLRLFLSYCRSLDRHPTFAMDITYVTERIIGKYIPYYFIPLKIQVSISLKKKNLSCLLCFSNNVSTNGNRCHVQKQSERSHAHAQDQTWNQLHGREIFFFSKNIKVNNTYFLIKLNQERKLIFCSFSGI